MNSKIILRQEFSAEPDLWNIPEGYSTREPLEYRWCQRYRKRETPDTDTLQSGNSANDFWSIADLARHKVFANAKAHIRKSPKNEFHFISPLSYKNLDDLCERARRNHSAEDFIKAATSIPVPYFP